ncbi:MAG: response regulator [Burkholderiaceae bacterium]
MRVLLVDDNRLVRMTLAAGLSACGHEVADAESAEEALEVLDARPIDVVVSDIEMPGLGGIALGRELRGRSSRLRCVALTASQISALEYAAMHELFERVLSKPISAAMLDQVLRDLAD